MNSQSLHIKIKRIKNIHNVLQNWLPSYPIKGLDYFIT